MVGSILSVYSIVEPEFKRGGVQRVVLKLLERHATVKCLRVHLLEANITIKPQFSNRSNL